MALLEQDINKTENFLASFIKEKISDVLGLETFILPKFSKGDTEFVGILLTTLTPEELDSGNLSYNIITRLSLLRETLLADRNKLIAIFLSIEEDLKAAALAGDIDTAFLFERSEDMNFELSDDFYDSIFSIDILL